MSLIDQHIMEPGVTREGSDSKYNENGPKANMSLIDQHIMEPGVTREGSDTCAAPDPIHNHNISGASVAHTTMRVQREGCDDKMIETRIAEHQVPERKIDSTVLLLDEYLIENPSIVPECTAPDSHILKSNVNLAADTEPIEHNTRMSCSLESIPIFASSQCNGTDSTVNLDAFSRKNNASQAQLRATHHTVNGHETLAPDLHNTDHNNEVAVNTARLQELDKSDRDRDQERNVA
jgi:hypothetical protein